MTPIPDEVASFERLVRIETKIDAFKDGYADHEARLRKLERTMWLLAGAATVGGGLVGQLLAPLIK